MRVGRFVFVVVAGFAAACSPPAAPPAQSGSSAGAGRAITDPSAIVLQLYEPYAVPDGSVPALLEAAPWSARLHGELAAMLARARAQGEPILDFDPIINAQDYHLGAVAAAPEAVVEGSHAVVRARFQNGGLNEEVVYDLVWQDDRWKVDNIRTPDWDLRAIATSS